MFTTERFHCVVLAALVISALYVDVFIHYSDLSCSSGELCDKHEKLEHSCETLLMCMITVFKDGVKAGGGIGDVIRKPSTSVSKATPIIVLSLFLSLSIISSICLSL